MICDVRRPTEGVDTAVAVERIAGAGRAGQEVRAARDVPAGPVSADCDRRAHRASVTRRGEGMQPTEPIEHVSRVTLAAWDDGDSPPYAPDADRVTRHVR